MFNRGGFPAQRPMGHTPMNQPSMNLPGMNMTGMNMSGMNLSGMSMPGMTMSSMGMSPMNQPNMNLTGMNHPGMNHQRMGHPGMTHQNMGLSGMSQPNMNMNLNRMNQPNMNLNRMNHPDINQGGGMGFRPEMNNQAFGMRPMDNTGAFGGGNTDSMGMSIRPAMHTPDMLMGPQVLPQRFSSPSVPMHHGQPRMPTQTQEIPSIVNRVVTHSSDPMMMKPKAPLQEPAHVMKKTQWGTNVYGNEGQDMGMKLVPSGPSLDNVSNVQNRYTNESASSILESFGLSNEDLEELSRYPDDQLTPGNMPAILRDIRLRKISRPAPASVPEQTPERRPASEAAPSNIIDYGHSSKYNYNEPATSVRSYDSPRKAQKPPQAKKETVAPNIAKSQITPEEKMDNKIPTLSGSRKPVWHSSSKPARSNNKTLVGKPTTPAPVALVTVPTNENLETVSTTENPVIAIKEDAAAIPDVAPPVYTELTPAVQIVAGVSQVTYQQPAEKPAASKEGYVPVLSQEEAQKMKKLPTPSMMNDYYAASPRIFPHICSLCNVECRHLKDWIKHQNNTSHIESCRNLHQQYPDWNPQVLSSLRNEGKKDEPASKKSKSKSPSPHRSRRSGSRHRVRKSRSHSPKSGGRRSRSRSPHRSRHSPKRSRSPRRGPRSPLRSRSPRRHTQSSHSKSPDKKAVDAAVQSFIEATKFKCGPRYPKPSNGKKATSKPYNPNDRSKKPASSAPTPKKSDTTASKSGSTSNSSSSSSRPSSAQTPKKSITAASRSGTSSSSKPSSSSSSSKPSYTSSATKKSTYGSSNTKKPVVSSGAKKTTMSTSSGKKTSPSKWSAPKIPPPAAPGSNRINKFIAKNNNKIIHVTNLPDKGYTDQDILKLAEPFGKVCDILIIRSRNEAFMETNFKEAAAAAVKYSESVPVKINNKQVTLSLFGQKKTYVKSPEQNEKVKPATKSAEQTDLPPGFIKRYMLEDPPLKHDDKCVILISNLPDSQYTVDEITNLAKPFGGVTDVLVVSTHKEAYLQLPSRTSVDSMIKFYNVFPTYLGGNLLSISVAGRYKDLKNEDLIFADLIEQASYKITPSIYETFVHLTNLPETPVEDFEIMRVGLRFGRVEHHVIFSNKQKAIVHMHSPSAAKAMHSFLSQYPCSIGENVIKCSLPSQTTLAEDEYRAYIEEDKPSQVINTEKLKAPESKKPEVTENPKAPESKKPEVTEKPTAPDSKKPDVTEKPTAPDSKKPSVTEKPAAPEFKKPSVTEKPTAPESKKPSDTEEKLSATDDTQSENEPGPPSPISDTEMEVDSAEPVESSAPEGSPKPEDASAPPACITEVTSDTSAETPAEPSTFYMVATDDDDDDGNDDDDDDDEEEAAQAPEASDSSPLYIQAEPETYHPEPLSVSHPQLSEELEVLVSVESDEEESEELEHIPLGTEKDLEASADEGTSDSPEAERKQGHLLKANLNPAGKVEEKNMLKLKPEATSAKGEAGKEGPESGATSSASIRTTKYNAQKGEISVTVTMESQRATLKTVDSRKRSSRERGTSYFESSTPRSNSNRSSPADSASSHSKSGSKKSIGKYVTSQSERDSKDIARTREREARTSSRKDDRTRGSTSSRYSRSSKSNNRSPRSKEQEESFPFNLDEFVTVDEIVEEHIDPKKNAGEPDTARKGKRKENDSVTSETKKSRMVSGESPELSFVTLDEVGDEEESACAQENKADKTDQSLVTEDEMATEDVPAITKDKQMLMTLDEISDDDEAQDPSTVQLSSAMPKTSNKGQLVVGEEQTAATVNSKVDKAKLVQETKDASVKEVYCIKEPEEKQQPEGRQGTPARRDHLAQPLVTLDEVKTEDDDEMSFADIEHQFLTVDEVGEEEEESENKPKPDGDSKSSKAKVSDQSKASEPTPPARRGRPRKRPLPESAEGNKVSLQQVGSPHTSKGAAPSSIPAEAKLAKDNKKEATECVKDGATTTGKPADKRSGAEAPAKKSKLETPPAGKTKLAPYNSSTAVGLEFLVPKTGYFCELCSLFYMDDSSKLKHCRSLRHYQQVEKHLDTLPAAPEEKSSST